MALDLAYDFQKKDLVASPSLDFDICSGQQTINQRIRVRLFIEQGEWVLDPTGGRLGSRIKSVFRLGPNRALTELPLVVREALADMTDIEVVDVTCAINPDNARAIDMTISYRMTADGVGETISTALTVVG